MVARPNDRAASTSATGQIFSNRSLDWVQTKARDGFGDAGGLHDPNYLCALGTVRFRTRVQRVSRMLIRRTSEDEPSYVALIV